MSAFTLIELLVIGGRNAGAGEKAKGFLQAVTTRRSFTLIELLVVIAIIAVLVAVLLPAMGSARESARTVLCGSNQRQVSVSLMLYLDMFNNVLPNCSGSGYWYNWSFKLIQARVLDSAIGSAYSTAWTGSTPASVFKGIMPARPGEMKTVLHCPSLSEADLGDSPKSYYVNAYGTPQGSLGSAGGTHNQSWPRISAHEYPSRVVAAFDSTNLAGGSNNQDVGAIWVSIFDPYKRNLLYFFSLRHNGMSNCLFLDGHVERLVLEETTREMFPTRSDLPK